MRHIHQRSFEGPAGELVRLEVHAPGTAAIRIWLDGAPQPATTQFALSGTQRLAVMLAGEPGETATVSLSPVNGATYRDVILITAHDPFPLHHYGFRAL